MAALAITGIGAVTPVGLSADASAAAFRASIPGMGPILSTLIASDSGGPEPITGGRVPLEWFDGGPRDEEWPGHERFGTPIPTPDHLLVEDGLERLVRLAVPAATESLRGQLGTSPPPTEFGLYLGIGAGESRETGQALAAAVAKALSGFRPAKTQVYRLGRAAGLVALHSAAADIADGKIRGAIVGGVDSLVRPTTFGKMSAAGLVKAAADAPGVMPGEAAAFCVLEKDPRASAIVWLQVTAYAEEPTAGTTDPNQGVGLTKVLRAVREAGDFSHSPLVICDLDGDRYRALEWGLVGVRVFGDLHEDPEAPAAGQTWHPADCVGDTGAASGIMNCVWAAEILRKGYGRVDRIVVWGASHERPRAAALLTMEP